MLTCYAFRRRHHDMLVSMAVSIRRLIHQIAIIPKEDVMTNLMEGEIIQRMLHAAHCLKRMERRSLLS